MVKLNTILFLMLSILFISCSNGDDNATNTETEEAIEMVEEVVAEDPFDDGPIEEPEPEPPIEGPMPQETDLIWFDEFDGDSLDEEKWSYQRGGWNGSNVQNCYVDENTTVENGLLRITAKYEPGYDCFNSVTDFTSGFVQTKNKIDWTYGYFEALVRVPASNSTWPAFWMSPQEDVYGAWPRSGEIDIFEIKGHDMTKSFGNAHWGISGSERRQDKGTFEFEDATEWHLYAVDWREGEMNFFIDGELYHTINDFKAPNATEPPGPFDQGFYLRLNMAVGGNYLDEPHNDANNNIDQLPAVMEVDYVRVYSKKPGC